MGGSMSGEEGTNPHCQYLCLPRPSGASETFSEKWGFQDHV